MRIDPRNGATVLRPLRALSALLVWTALLLAGASLLPVRLWPLEIAASLRVPILGVGFVAGTLALLLRLRVSAVIAFASTAVQLLLLVPLFVPFFAGAGGGRPAGEEERELLVLSMNVEWSNRESDSLFALVRALDTDIVALQEIDYWWRRKLEALRDVYPYRTFDLRSARPGVAVLARRAPAEEAWYPLEGRAACLLRFGDGEGAYHLAVAHAYPPKSTRLYDLRNRQIDSLATLLARVSGPLVLAGDLNATPWSPVLRDLERKTRLRSARIGRGVLPTWPAWSSIMRVPIDHIHHAESIRTMEIERVSIPGSDHIGLLARLALPPGHH